MLRKLILAVTALTTLAAPLALPTVAYAQNKDDVCQGVGIASGGSGTCDAAQGNKVNDAVKTGVRIFQIVVGLIALFMIIMGGLRFVTSNGDSGKVASARNTILYAAIGLAIVGLAEVIIQFVINRLPS